MNKKSGNFPVNNLVATDGFCFSGSGLVNDIFRDSGYAVPKDVRADELFDNKNNFSWPRALSNEYNFYERAILTCRLVKTILIRFPLNLIQKTFIYKRYLVFKGRATRLHQPTSVNRNLWSYLLSVYMVIFRHTYNGKVFNKWLVSKYRWQINSNKNLLLDNGIPKDKRVADLLFSITGSIGIFVYRNPKIQFQQILQIYKSTGQSAISYEDFLKDLESQYKSLDWILSSNYQLLIISFDKLLNDRNYRNLLEIYFRKIHVLDEFNYDFSESINNNDFLSSRADKSPTSKVDVELENIILEFHELFEKDTVAKIQR